MFCFSSIKDNTDIISNELFQTIAGMCLLCVHVRYIYMYNQLPIKYSWTFLWKSGKSQYKVREVVFRDTGLITTFVNFTDVKGE